MGKYSVPENIRRLKPRGTMVKAISGNYYVYEYSCVMKDGKRTTKMGKCIGSIKEGIGFVSNNERICEETISVLEYGQYAAAYHCSQDVLEILKKFFNAEDAVQIYVMGLIHFVNGFCYLKDMKQFFDMSWLSIQYPSLKMGYEALSNLYDALGRRQGTCASRLWIFECLSKYRVMIAVTPPDEMSAISIVLIKSHAINYPLRNLRCSRLQEP